MRRYHSDRVLYKSIKMAEMKVKVAVKRQGFNVQYMLELDRDHLPSRLEDDLDEGLEITMEQVEG